MKTCVVLFSGGIDSTTALHWALARYSKVHSLTFDYGQRHRIELEMAKKIAGHLAISHRGLKVDLRQIGGSALTDADLSVPEFDDITQIERGLPPTYVPFRNGIFLALAAAWAETEGIRDIVCGFNIIDSLNYPDTREEFVRAMERAVNSGTRASVAGEKVKIRAPFIRMKKSEIIRLGLSLGTDYSYTISCYKGEEIPCQRCSSCLLRKRAWEEVGVKDHLVERLTKEGKL